MKTKRLFGIRTETYAYRNGWNFDIVINEYTGIRDVYLYYYNYGIKMHMFGVQEKDKDKIMFGTQENDRDKFIQTVEANIDSYIEQYKEQYMDQEDPER